MKKFKDAPFNEDLSIYEAERKFLNQEPNQCIYYLNGKAIVQGDSGNLFFTEFPEEDKEHFLFGEQIEAEFLQPVTELSDDDRKQLYKLEQLNEEINPRGIYAVSMEKETNGKEETYFAVIHHLDHPENTYFRISIPDLHRLTPENIAELPEYNEERTLDDPYNVQVEDGGLMLAY